MVTVHANHLIFTVGNKTLQTQKDNNADYTPMVPFNSKQREQACDMVLHKGEAGMSCHGELTAEPRLQDSKRGGPHSILTRH